MTHGTEAPFRVGDKVSVRTAKTAWTVEWISPSGEWLRAKSPAGMTRSWDCAQLRLVERGEAEWTHEPDGRVTTPDGKVIRRSDQNFAVVTEWSTPVLGFWSGEPSSVTVELARDHEMQRFLFIALAGGVGDDDRDRRVALGKRAVLELAATLALLANAM